MARPTLQRPDNLANHPCTTLTGAKVKEHERTRLLCPPVQLAIVVSLPTLVAQARGQVEVCLGVCGMLSEAAEAEVEAEEAAEKEEHLVHKASLLILSAAGLAGVMVSLEKGAHLGVSVHGERP